MDPIIKKFRSKFIEEAHFLIEQMEQNLLELEQNYNNSELIHALFRAMHTIKGTSSMYGFEAISEFTHNLESLYQNIRDKKTALSKDLIDLTFQSIDLIRQLLQDENMADEKIKNTHSNLTKQVISYLSSSLKNDDNIIKNDGQSNTPCNEEHTFQILLKTDEKLFFRGINLINIFQDLAHNGTYHIEFLKSLSDDNADWWNIIYVTNASIDDLKEILMFIEDNCLISYLSDENLIEKKGTTPLKTEKSLLEIIENKNSDYTPKCENKKSNISHFSSGRITVDSAKLDQLMYLVSELITINSQLNMVYQNEVNSKIAMYLEKLDNLSKYFRNNVLELRLIPIAEITLRFKRLIRDLSKQLNKKVKLVTHGIDTELDKGTIDQLYEPLMHIIRNCIDHGIEPPMIRMQKGKSEEGIITFTATHAGNHIVIKIEDDGCGIDHEKVRRKAVDKGIWPENYIPTEQEIYDLIFLPGFSTAQSLTEVSGRGVGMDVVLKKIKDMRGNIIVKSEKEKGTSFTLYLQQSMAILDTLLFSVEDKFFIVPISDIKICDQMYYETINQSHSGTIPFENELIPTINLRKTLRLKGNYPEKVKIIVVNYSQNQMAILADKIIGEHQAVLKPLSNALQNQLYINAVSQLGDGNIAFMLDLSQLYHHIFHHHVLVQTC